MLKKLTLNNFQKHEHLELNFVNGVNVLYGASDIGKSCIRRAIEWIVQNENIDGIRKTGTKKTSVSILLDDDIEIERIRSQSINRYIIRKDGDEQIFDAVGKSIPSEVKKVLTIYPIEVDGEEIYLNSQPQIGLPFLFDKSPAFRMKLFNKLTGNDVLDKLFGEFNKDILRIKRDIREETDRFENRKDTLQSKKIEMEKAVAVHTRLKKRMLCLKQKYIKYENLLKLRENMESVFGNQKNVVSNIKGIKIPEDDVLQVLRKNIDRYDLLVTLERSFEKVDIGLDKVREGLKDYKPVSIDYGDLRGKIERFGKIGVIYEKFSQNQGLLKDFRKKSKIVDMDLKQMNKEFDKYEVCKDCDGRGVKFNERD